MKRVIVAMLAIAMTAAPVAAQGRWMTVQTFLDKVAGLKRQGMMALFSPDVGLIKTEMKAAGTELKAEAAARKAAGRPPIACPPADKNARKMGSDEFIAALEAIPPAQRGMSIKDGLSRVIATKYPCRG